MTRIVWKFCFTLYTSNSNFWEKYQFWLKNVSSIKEQLVGKGESFKVKFWPKPSIQNNPNTKPLNLELLKQLSCFIFLSWLEKFFEVTENVQNIQVQSRMDQVTAKNFFAPTILDKKTGTKKVKKYSKIGQGFRNIIYTFACFLTAIVSV